MESMDLDMGEIFDEAEADDDFPQITALPDLPDYTENAEDGDAENNEVLAQLKDLSKGASKRVVRRPQPKLDPDRLTGARGIPILPKLFENVKLKGKGHEAEDLKMVMRRLEHWTHRLFPSMPFDQVLERIEKLGAKKQVQTCVKKMRLDMPLLDEDFVGPTGEENDIDQAARAADVFPDISSDEDMEQNIVEKEDAEHITPSAISPSTPAANISEPVLDTPGSSQPPGTPMQYLTPGTSADTSASSLPNGLTPEQKERIEHNKRLAMEKRAARLGLKVLGSPLSSNSRQKTQTPNSTQDLTTASSHSSQNLSSQRISSDDPKQNSQPATRSDSMADTCMSEIIPMPSQSQNTSGINSSDMEEMSQTIPNQNEKSLEDQQIFGDSIAAAAVMSPQSENTGNTGASKQAPHGSQHLDETPSQSAHPETSADVREIIPMKSQTQNLNGVISNDSEEMSEIIPNQNEKLSEIHKNVGTHPETSADVREIIPMKSQTQNLNEIISNDSEKMSEIIPNQNEKLSEIHKNVGDTITTTDVIMENPCFSSQLESSSILSASMRDSDGSHNLEKVVDGSGEMSDTIPNPNSQPKKSLNNPEKNITDVNSTNSVEKNTDINSTSVNDDINEHIISDKNTGNIINNIGLTNEGVQAPRDTDCGIVEKDDCSDVMLTEDMSPLQNKIIPNLADDRTVKPEKSAIMVNGSLGTEQTLQNAKDQQTEEELVQFLDEQ